MSKIKQRKKRLNSLILLLLLTAVLLIVSTYAWFTSNQTVTISSLEVNVGTSSGLQISVDGINWKSLISNEDITNAHNTYAAAKNQIPTSMEPCSTALNLNENGELNMFYGSVEADEDGNYALTSTLQSDAETSGFSSEELATKYYIAFDMFLKSDKEVENLYLTRNSDVKSTDDVSKGLENASRVAFVLEGNVADGSATSAIQGLKTADDANVHMWEPNYDAHTSTGVANAYSLFKLTLNAGNGNDLVSYDGVSADCSAIPLTKCTSTDNGAYFAAVEPTYKTIKEHTDDVSVFGGLKSGITKVRVYMWVEGQDVDCENNASGSNIAYDLQFSLNQSE